jgi:hypothetical protein
MEGNYRVEQHWGFRGQERNPGTIQIPAKQVQAAPVTIYKQTPSREGAE